MIDDPVTRPESARDWLPATARALRDPQPDAPAALLASATTSMPDGIADALRGEAARRAGDTASAVPLLRRAIAQHPDLLPAYHRLGLALVATGDRAGARAAWQALLARDPDDPLARFQIGVTHDDDGAPALAAQWYEDQLRVAPTMAAALHNLGRARLALGEPAAAAIALQALVTARPDHYDGWLALGTALARSRDDTGALRAWHTAAALRPTEALPLVRAAGLLGARADLPAAIALLEQALAREPRHASASWARAAHLSSLGEHLHALAAFRRARELAPDDAQGHSALLLELQYDCALATRDEITHAHREWAACHGGVAPIVMGARSTPHQSTAGTDRRLRIGYVSPRFAAGPVANLLLPVLEHHDRARFHVTLYAGDARADAWTGRMRAAADGWRVLPADDDAAAALIATDGLDLLVDLAGHAPGHRLQVVARRPAPVVATWLDSFYSTGLTQIDYLVSDAVHTPPDDARFFSEQLALLPGCRLAYLPLATQVALPARGAPAAPVVFGSFNRHAKLTDDTLRLWTRVLDTVAQSRLALRASAYRGEGTIDHVRRRWSALGVPVERIDFLPWLALDEAIASYAGIDIALDPFPYNGGITTCDALSAGVPVVTLHGDRMVARQGAALLTAAGHPEWIARSGDDYVAIAADLAQRVRTTDLRARLADDVRRSALCDTRGFTARLERAWTALVARGPRAGPPGPALALPE